MCQLSFDLRMELQVVAETCGGETEGEGPPDAGGSHAEGKGEDVGKGDADEAIGYEGIEHHGSDMGYGTEGVGIGDLEAVTNLIADKGGKEG